MDHEPKYKSPQKGGRNHAALAIGLSHLAITFATDLVDHGVSVWCASIRWTVCGEIASTMPSRTNCRASSALSHCDRERPTTSGRSQASLITYNATTGGKNRPSAGAFFVGQTLDARRDKAQRPFADMPFAEFHYPFENQEYFKEN